MKNVIERVSELEAALRKRSPCHERDCDARERLQSDRVTMKASGPCMCGHDDAMKALRDDVISIDVPADGSTYRFFQTADGATCVSLNGFSLETFSRSSGAILAIMRELLAARDKLIDLQGHAR